MIYILVAVCVVAFIGLGTFFVSLLFGGLDGPTLLGMAIGIVGLTLMLAFVLWGLSALESKSTVTCVNHSGKICQVWIRG